MEIKYSQTDTLAVSKIKPHQIRALKLAKHGSFKWKIADLGQRNPFDVFVLKQVPAYLVIIFNAGKDFRKLDVDKIPTRGSIKIEDCESLTASEV